MFGRLAVYRIQGNAITLPCGVVVDHLNHSRKISFDPPPPLLQCSRYHYILLSIFPRFSTQTWNQGGADLSYVRRGCFTFLLRFSPSSSYLFLISSFLYRNELYEIYIFIQPTQGQGALYQPLHHMSQYSNKM